MNTQQTNTAPNQEALPNRSEIYDSLADIIAPLTLMLDMSVSHQANAEISIHADEFSQVLSNIVRKLKATQDSLYKG